MNVTRMSQLRGSHLGFLNGLRDKRIDPGELRLAQIHVNAAEDIDDLRNR